MTPATHGGAENSQRTVAASQMGGDRQPVGSGADNDGVDDGRGQDKSPVKPLCADEHRITAVTSIPMRVDASHRIVGAIAATGTARIHAPHMFGQGDHLTLPAHGPEVLLATSTWWPLSARLAMALRDGGCHVDAICPPGHPLHAVTGIDRLFRYSHNDSLGALRRAIVEARPRIIVPCDDGVVWQLHELHARDPALRELIEYSLGPADTYPIIRSRERLLRVAGELGIRVPATRQIASAHELEAWLAQASSPGVLKLDQTWGGKGVQIVHSRHDALRAWHKFSTRPSAAFAWKRSLIDHDPLALWTWRSRREPVVTIQQHVAGQPANTMFVCQRGELLSLVTVKVLSALGPTGAAIVVQLIANEEIEHAARLLAKRLHLSGFCGLDFMLETATGVAQLIELNPRCTQLGHLQWPGSASLAATFAEMLGGRAAPNSSQTIGSETVAFFPQAFDLDSAAPMQHIGHYDIPWSEPQLVRELLLPIWPERQWPARLYHRFRPVHGEPAIRFDEMSTAPAGRPLAT